MPTGLIHIEDERGSQYLRLRDADFMNYKPYAALSYCWGRKQLNITTTQNIHQNHRRINIWELPLSLQDADSITINLRLPCLRIGALYIIQDDTDDRAHEISQMPLVYSKATVTIVASRVSEANEGFLRDRLLLVNEEAEHVFKIPYQLKKDADPVGPIVLLPQVMDLVEPPSQRAWALQERLMSPGIPEYGSLQTRWICNHSLKHKRKIYC